MYIPRVNEEKDLAVLHQFMRENSFCTLVTQTPAGMIASHIPMMLEEDGSEYGVLRGHVARANPQWKDADTSTEALAIFNGPDHYVSASWYPSKLKDGKVVPTWNYVAVHAYGSLRIVQDAEWLLTHLHSLTDRNEAGMASPWKVSDPPAGFIETMMKGIVGFEIPIRRLEGKWKVSQNRNDEDAAGVAHALGELDTAAGLAMKALVELRRRSS